MSLGKQHTLIYPQDKSYNYQFPANNGLLASENYVGETITNELDVFVPSKRKVEQGLGFVTTYITLSSTLISTDSTFKDVTGFAFDVIAGKTYDIELIGAYQSNLITMGCKLGVRLTSGTGTILGYIAGAIANTAVATELKASIRAINSSATTTGSFIVTTAVAPINQDHNIEARLSFTCATDGRFTFTFGNETTGTANVSLIQKSQLKVIEY